MKTEYNLFYYWFYAYYMFQQLVRALCRFNKFEFEIRINKLNMNLKFDIIFYTHFQLVYWIFLLLSVTFCAP